jgi:hypothetical protein
VVGESSVPASDATGEIDRIEVLPKVGKICFSRSLP